MPRSRAKDSEVHAYIFIKATLRQLGWDVRNPQRATSGQVWTQNECLSNPEIKRCLGLDKPENVVKVTERVLWVIEAKRSHAQLEQALREAENYADSFRGGGQYVARFISGVAGNEIDSFLVRTKYFNGQRFVPVTLNGIEATGLLAQPDLLRILETDNADIGEPQIDERLFINRAEHINQTSWCCHSTSACKYNGSLATLHHGANLSQH